MSSKGSPLMKYSATNSTFPVLSPSPPLVLPKTVRKLQLPGKSISKLLPHSCSRGRMGSLDKVIHFSKEVALQRPQPLLGGFRLFAMWNKGSIFRSY